MQSTHFLDFWRPRLAEDGYDAIFKKKGNDLYIGGNVAAIDGCATFFKRSRFQLVKKYEVGIAPGADSGSGPRVSLMYRWQPQINPCSLRVYRQAMCLTSTVPRTWA